MSGMGLLFSRIFHFKLRVTSVPNAVWVSLITRWCSHWDIPNIFTFMTSIQMPLLCDTKNVTHSWGSLRTGMELVTSNLVNIVLPFS